MAIRVGELFVDISVSTSKLRANLAQASSLIRDWSLVVTGLTAGASNAFRQISEIGIKAVQIGLVALSASFGMAAKAGADFQDEIVRAFTILKEGSNATQLSLMKLTDTARLLGRETLFSAIDAAEGMQILAKAGFDTGEILRSIKPSLDLAIVGNIELAQSADFVISALKGFNLEADKSTMVADVLALASAKANMTISDLGSALSYVAPVATGAGLSIQETAAAVGILSNAGIKASRAGTTLRRALSVLLAPTATAQGIMDKYGITVLDTAGNMKPLVDIIRQLNTSGITTAETMKMFGLRAGPGMLALLREGSQGLLNLEQRLNSADGAANRMSQNFRTTVKGRIRDLSASLVDLGLAFSEQFEKPLARAIFGFRNFVVQVVRIGNSMSIFKTLVIGVQRALEPINDLILELSRSFIIWLKTLKPSDVLAFFDTIRGSISALLDSLREGEAGAILKDTLKSIAILAKTAAAAIMLMGKAWMALPRGVRDVIRPLLITLAIITKLAGGLLPLITGFIALKAILGALSIKLAVGKALAIGLGIAFKSILVFVGIIGAVIAGWKILDKLRETENLKEGWTTLLSVLDEVKKAVGEMFQGLSEFVPDFVNDFANQIVTIIPQAFSTAFGKVKETLGGFIGNFFEGRGKVEPGLDLSKPLRGGVFQREGGEKVLLGEFGEAQKEIDFIKGMINRTSNIEGDATAQAAVRVGLLTAFSERLNKLEEVVMTEKTEINNLNRQVRKPITDRLDKSNLSVGME